MREKYNKVVALEWKNSGIRTFLAIPHGGVPTWTCTLENAFRVNEEWFRKILLTDCPALRQSIRAWKVMTEEEAKAWMATWSDIDPLMTIDIPYWE